jgi:Kef-type K+ transport system membrane component KefB
MHFEIAYLILIPALLIVPRALQRFLLPAPLACFGFGLLTAVFLGALPQMALLSLMATLGVSTLFLYAGIETDLHVLRGGARELAAHLALRLVNLGALTWAAMQFLGLSWQAGCLLALALLTPSTGFILDTLSSLGLTDEERRSVTNKAIGGELLALVMLFVVLQSDSLAGFATSSAVLVALIVILPLAYLALGRLVVRVAPGSEFSLLIMIGLLAASATDHLGVEYLVGAFLAGLTARLMRGRIPGFASDANLHAVKLFASFFVPFYFFYRGLSVPHKVLGWNALTAGLVAIAVLAPLRVGLVWLQRRLVMKEDGHASLRVAIALVPTLIFTLVLATILRERYGISETIYGALLVYAAVTTLLPSLVMARPFDLDATHLERDETDRG